MIKQKVKKGVIVVGGLGTRFLPATKAMPKEMLPVLDKPILQFIVEEMADSGITEIIFVTSSQKRAIEDHFDRDKNFEEYLKSKGKESSIKSLVELTEKVKFFYTRQSTPLGNGDAMLCAREFVGDEPFILSDGDSIIDAKVPATKQLITAFNKKQTSIIGAQKITDRQMMIKYGNIFAKPTTEKRLYRVEKFVEKPDIKNTSPLGLIVGGMRYVFTKDIWPVLAEQEKGTGGELWVADAANSLAKKKPFYAYEYEGKYFDTGNKVALLNTIIYFAHKEGLLTDLRI
jgi:UTP--glucose-1-phosphate uridylyltransferase